MNQLIGLVLYYVIFPVGCVTAFIYIRGTSREIRYLRTFKEEERREADIQHMLNKLRKYEAIFVVFLIAFLPLWSHSASIYADSMMHNEYRGGLTAMGRAYGSLDPVKSQLGPSYDIEHIKKSMEEKPGFWMPEEVEEQIDLDKLTRVPGRLALYRLKDRRYVVVYTYMAPYPIIKSYGFYQTTDYELVLLSEKTTIFPLSPNRAGKVYAT